MMPESFAETRWDRYDPLASLALAALASPVRPPSTRNREAPVPRARSALQSVAVLLVSGLVSCSAPDPVPSLVVQRDSAGVRIIEALRPLWGDAGGWSIDPDPIVDLTLSGNGTPHEFFRVRDVKQRSDGSVVVADRGSQEVRLYSSSGGFLGSAGGAGDGPGEFRNLWKLEPTAEDILALDQRGRITVFAADLEPTRTIDVAARVFDLHDLRDGTVLVEVRSLTEIEPGPQIIRGSSALLRYDLSGARIDSLGEIAGYEEVRRVIDDRPILGPPLFGREGHLAANGDVILVGSADLMEVRELSVTGDVVRILRIPDYPLGVTDEEVSAEREAQFDVELPPGATFPPPIRRFIEELPAPAARPAYADILVDPSGAIWLELYRGRSEQDQPQAWLVLDSDGTWLGTVDAPNDFAVMDVTTHAVLGVWTDELGVEHPQVLTLARTPTGM